MPNKTGSGVDWSHICGALGIVHNATYDDALSAIQNLKDNSKESQRDRWYIARLSSNELDEDIGWMNEHALSGFRLAFVVQLEEGGLLYIMGLIRPDLGARRDHC